MILAGRLSVLDYEIIGLNYEGWDLARLLCMAPMWKQAGKLLLDIIIISCCDVGQSEAVMFVLTLVNIYAYRTRNRIYARAVSHHIIWR